MAEGGRSPPPYEGGEESPPPEDRPRAESVKGRAQGHVYTIDVPAFKVVQKPVKRKKQAKKPTKNFRYHCPPVSIYVPFSTVYRPVVVPTEAIDIPSDPPIKAMRPPFFFWPTRFQEQMRTMQPHNPEDFKGYLQATVIQGPRDELDDVGPPAPPKEPEVEKGKKGEDLFRPTKPEKEAQTSNFGRQFTGAEGIMGGKKGFIYGEGHTWFEPPEPRVERARSSLHTYGPLVPGVSERNPRPIKKVFPRRELSRSQSVPLPQEVAEGEAPAPMTPEELRKCLTDPAQGQMYAIGLHGRKPTSQAFTTRLQTSRPSYHTILKTAKKDVWKSRLAEAKTEAGQDAVEEMVDEIGDEDEALREQLQGSSSLSVPASYRSLPVSPQFRRHQELQGYLDRRPDVAQAAYPSSSSGSSRSSSGTSSEEEERHVVRVPNWIFRR